MVEMVRGAALEQLIKPSINPNESVLIHGTSVESALSLLKRGKLDPSVFPFNECPDSFAPKDYLYFTLNTGGSIDSPLAGARTYAGNSAKLHFMATEFGYWPNFITTYDLAHDFYIDPTDEAFAKELKRFYSEAASIGFTEQRVLQIFNRAEERKGVLFGFSPKIFELPIEPDPEDEEGYFRLHAPNGLDGEYVNAIEPLGDIEKNILTAERKWN